MKNMSALVLSLSFILIAACSSGPQVKSQNYAKLLNTKDFEEDYLVVWKGVIAALGEYKIEEKDQEKGFVKTDWIYSTSNEKYVEYQVNGFPRKKYLQTRYKFLIPVERQIEKVKVTVNLQEEIENLKSDGSADGWRGVSEPDATRANDMLKSIEMKILSRPE